MSPPPGNSKIPQGAGGFSSLKESYFAGLQARAFAVLRRLDEMQLWSYPPNPAYGFSAALAGANEPILLNSVIISIGSGKTMVVFFSTPISARVCR